MAFGMILTAGLLWRGGMIWPAPRPAWANAPLVGNVKLTPVDGDPFADISIAQPPALTEEAPSDPNIRH